MKNLTIVFATIVLLSLPTFAERPYNSCGKNCDGSCSASFENCGLGDGFSCILNCCRAAPNPGSEECGNVLPMSVGVR